MPFELHTWGPAFSLPSLDPDCLAAIAYLRLTLPPDTWVLIPSSDVSVSTTRDLPALKDGDVVVGGFHNIVGYLARISNGEWNLDSPTYFPSPISRADIIAFQSHIPTHAHPILSLLLYLSPQNYSHVTRPAYTPLLPWPAQYIIPPQRRAAAQTRCEHLGMQGADFDDDDANDDNAGGRRPKFGGDMLSDALSGTPTTTAQNKKNPTVTSALKSHLSSAQSQLPPAIDALCAPLTTFLSNNPTSSTASCLALAYLSLLLVPSLPISWMQQLIRARYPTLSAFVERGVSDIYAGKTDVQEVMEGKMKRESKDLPWRKPEIVGAKMAERMIWGSLVDQLPIFGGGSILHKSSLEPRNDNERKDELSRTSLTFIPAAIAMTTTTLAAAVAGIGYLSYTYYTTRSLDKTKKLSDMGEAGALFSALDFGGGGDPMMSEEKGEARARVIPVGVEVDVDVSGDGEV